MQCDVPDRRLDSKKNHWGGRGSVKNYFFFWKDRRVFFLEERTFSKDFVQKMSTLIQPRIAVGGMLPAVKVYEFIQEEGDGCSVGRPDSLQVDTAIANKKIVLFAVPGAFTPTCSSQHVPGFLESYDLLKEKGVDEIWCLSVNDPFVMGAWGKDLSVGT